jgi:amino acid transporter
MTFSMSTLLVGRPIANSESQARRIGVFQGVPAMGLDGLGSAAYGPEAALAILAVAGAGGLQVFNPISWIIVLLLAVLFASYRQTIAAYPSNGGCYVVAKENLGSRAGLLAAAALMIDYLLNVGVGISAGVAALTSALPMLQPYTLALCMTLLAAVTLLNLRGTGESGLALAAPTYLFILSLGGILIYGVVQVWLARGHPHAVIAPPALPHASHAIGLWLVLRAFASGCTAMTGVEAVSNGVSAFREPTVRNAHRTLTFIVVVLGLLLLGIAQVTHGYGIMAMDQTKPGYQSVLSQLIVAVCGRGWLYYVTIGSVLSVLCLSANTSFVGFPRLCHLVAEDGFLPRGFALPGRRLIYTVGVVFLAAGSGGLLLAFGGITDRLIPLFAVGAFLSFTLSQAGMAAHWWGRIQSKRQCAMDVLRLTINGVGAIVTGVSLSIILLAKFVEGAWLTVIVIPVTILALQGVRRYYDNLDARLLRGAERVISLQGRDHTIALVPIARWDRPSRKAVEYALALCPEVVGVHITSLAGPDGEPVETTLLQDWETLVRQPAAAAGFAPPRLILDSSPYRSLSAPLLRATRTSQLESPGRPVLIVLPEVVEHRWWSLPLLGWRSVRLKKHLLHYGGPRLAVVSVPWQLGASSPGEGIAVEEPEGSPP